jgi:hypothetical protein
MKINLTSVGPSSADGSYGDNLHRLSKPTEVRRLNPITHARPGHASTPTLTGLATTRSYLSPPPPHHPTPTARPPAPTRLHAVKSAHQQPRSNYSPAWSAPPRHHLLYSWCLVELLHALAVLSPWCAASCAFHSLSLSNTGLTHMSLLPGRRPRPASPSPMPGLPSYRRRPAGARPLHRFLSHQPRHHRLTPPAPTSLIAARPSSTSLGCSSTRLSPSAGP